MLGQVSGHLRIPLMDRLEAIFYDARLRLTAQGTIDDRVVIVDIDEKSLIERERGGEGRWPWSRDRMAVLVDKLFDRYHSAVVTTPLWWDSTSCFQNAMNPREYVFSSALANGN
jgi:adenylate cyclase